MKTLVKENIKTIRELKEAIEMFGFDYNFAKPVTIYYTEDGIIIIQSQWRDAKKDPPEKFTDVLVHFKQGGEITRGHYEGDDKWYDDDESPWETTHWQPLPERPKN